MLLAFRFITGFVGSPVLATGGASLTDIYKPSKQAYAISLWGIAAGEYTCSMRLTFYSLLCCAKQHSAYETITCGFVFDLGAR